MSKKFLIGLAPLLVTAAFAVSPAAASAATREFGVCQAGAETSPPCEAGAGEEFVAFGAPTKVVSENTSNFVLKGETPLKEKVAITCATFSDEGVLENEATVGQGVNELTFSNCVVSEGALTGCEVEVTNSEVELEVNLGGATTSVQIKPGKEPFVSTTGLPAPCPAMALGPVTGTTIGSISGNELVFSPPGTGEGLTFLGSPATIKGNDATFTKVGHRPVYVN